MSFLSQLFAKRSSAPVARDRLQILLAHERASGGGEHQGELIAKLREEILEVIARHVPIDRDKVQIKLDRGAGVSTLEIDVEMPALKKAATAAAPEAAKAGPEKIAPEKTGPEKPGAEKTGPEKTGPAEAGAGGTDPGKMDPAAAAAIAPGTSAKAAS